MGTCGVRKNSKTGLKRLLNKSINPSRQSKAVCSCDVTHTAVTTTIKPETEKCVPTERVDSLPLSSMAFLIGHSHGPEAINSTPILDNAENPHGRHTRTSSEVDNILQDLEKGSLF